MSVSLDFCKRWKTITNVRALQWGLAAINRRLPKSNETRIIICKKMFRLGISFGRNDLNLEGHFQMEYNSKTIKNYGIVEKVNVKPPEQISTDVSCQTVQDSPKTEPEVVSE